MKISCLKFLFLLALPFCFLPQGFAQNSYNNGFLFNNLTIEKSKIMYGGPPKDGIPALEYPKFISVSENAYLNDSDKIIGVEHKGFAKAYPIRILNYHEIVNDRIGDFMYSVTYCPLCGSGVTFLAEVEGKTLTFGVSGLLYNSDVLLYDRNTESLWSQLEMQAISGEFSRTSLEIVPTELTTWKKWREKYPATRLLSDETGYHRNYTTSPYGNYNGSERLMFEVDKKDSRYGTKEPVIGIEWKGKFKAYPFEELTKTDKKIEDAFNGKNFNISYDKENRIALIKSEGKLYPSITLFWFAWFAFHPDTEVYKSR